MKKNLRLVLALTLGLATTAHAQDWSVDSRTRVNSISQKVEADNIDQTESFNENITRVGVAFGNENVGVVFSTNNRVFLGSDQGSNVMEVNSNLLDVHEMYVHTNIMDVAHMKAGRMALTFGSGRIIGSNDFNLNGATRDGALFGINNDFADLHVGYASSSFEDKGTPQYKASRTQTFVNVNKDFGDYAVNVLYAMDSEEETGADDMNTNDLGIDLTYNMGDIVFNGGYYHSGDGENDSLDMDLTSLGVTYTMSDDITLMASYDSYGDNGFYKGGSSFTGEGTLIDYANLSTAHTITGVGAKYTMGDLTLGAMYNMVSDEDSMTEDYNVIDAMASYSLSENSSVSLKYTTSDQAGEGNDVSRTWLSFNVSF